MAWNNKINFEELFGMKEDEFKTKLSAAETATAKVTELDTKFATFSQEIKDMLKNIQVTPIKSTEEHKATPEVKVEETKMPSFFEDEEGAFNARLQKALGPMATMTMQTSANLAYDRTKVQFKDFALFEEEVKAELKKAPLNYQSNEDYIRNCYHMVKGRHADEIAADAAKKSGKYFIEGASTNINAPVGTPDPNKVVLTDDELKYATKFGLKPEEYAKVKGGLKYV